MMKHTAGGMKTPVKIREFEVAIREMSNDELNSIRFEIENSLQHLKRSNARLQAYIDKIEGKEHQHEDNELLNDLTTDELDNIDHADLQLFSDSLKENNIILENQQQRLDALDQENIFRTSGLPKNGAENKESPVDPKLSVQAEERNDIYL